MCALTSKDQAVSHSVQAVEWQGLFHHEVLHLDPVFDGLTVEPGTGEVGGGGGGEALDRGCSENTGRRFVVDVRTIPMEDLAVLRTTENVLRLLGVELNL